MAGLLNGGCRWLSRIISTDPVGFLTSIRMSRVLRRSGRRSCVGFSHQSCSPACKAAAFVPASVMVVHSTRSKWTIFGPAVQPGVPLSPRFVFVEAPIDVHRAGHAFVGDEAERSAADHIGDLLERIAVGQALGHHHRRGGGRFAQRMGQQRKRLVQPEPDGAVIGRGKFVRGRHQRAAEGVAFGPAANAGDAVAGGDALAVMPQQTGTQRQRPESAIVFPRHGLRASAARACRCRPDRTACRTPYSHAHG